jgi:hypothetical protein
MKTIAIIMVLVCMSFLRLNGQIDRPNKRFQNLLPDSLITKPLFKYPERNFDLYSDKIIRPNLDQSLKHYHIESPEIKNSYDKLLAERFPGSEKFYAKRPYLKYPYEKSFVKKPDTTVKYYLIIKDPILNRRIN